MHSQSARAGCALFTYSALRFLHRPRLINLPHATDMSLARRKCFGKILQQMSILTSLGMLPPLLNGLDKRQPESSAHSCYLALGGMMCLQKCPTLNI